MSLRILVPNYGIGCGFHGHVIARSTKRIDDFKLFRASVTRLPGRVEEVRLTNDTIKATCMH